MRPLTRRQTMQLAAGGVLSGVLPLAASCASQPLVAADAGVPSEAGPALKDLAGAKGLRFGSAMSARQVRDRKYVDLIRRDCGVIVAENEFKQYAILPQPDQWAFDSGDSLASFAKTNGLAMRGHTLLWNRSKWLSPWVNALEFNSATQAEAWLSGYIERVAGRYHPFVSSWDVVNESIDDQTGDLCETVFSRAMGPELIDFCFHKAKQAAPDATLAYNDYMSWESGNENHRTGVLRLLERLKKNGAPIDALGIQSHSNFDMPNEFTTAKQRAWRSFVDDVVGMDLDIYITELDVNDTELAPDVDTRDRLIAAYTKDYLDLMLSYEQTRDVLAWGLVDSYSWLQGFLPRSDGVEKRPTLFDSNYQAKPMRAAVAAALQGAPARSS